ncbi:hypothetical protein O7631_07275 [Micromonospora sp. WMMD967]|uniref:VOC family protein n=1 Tax=Micromonospora sp. WMMD967 TaxID=3016101 RepID=UPI002415AAA2|nr:VOC family protein [Micromonospora sp. WMMD967]MDG4836313.1 hypothetical protein [Micromonospora sp. WMMD967]
MPHSMKERWCALPRLIAVRQVAAGADVVTEPTTQPWGYAGAFADPDGHLWMVSVDSGS